MRKRLFAPALAFVLMLVAGCGSLGLQQPEGFNDKLAYAFGTHTAIVQATTNSLNAHEITSEDANQVLQLAEESRTVLDAARIAYNAGDVKTAEGRLQLVTVALTQLQTYLRTRDANALADAVSKLNQAKEPIK